MSGSLVTEPASADGAAGRRLALVIAVTDYLDTSLRRLRAPAGDAAELRDLLADPEIGGFAVTSVINERAHQLRVAIEDFLADRRPDDLLLVYLSCHGLVDTRRRLYFAARDTFKHRLASSGLESHWLLEQLEDCRARRQVVILDCCFSGAFARGAKGDDDVGLGDRLVGEGRGRVVLTASRGTEYSFEGEPLDGEDAARGSVFTSALIEGIRTGRADNDRDGEISVEDAYAYAFEQVRRAGTQQTPQRWLYGAEGSILLAHAPPEAGRSSRPPLHRTSQPALGAAAAVAPPQEAVASPAGPLPDKTAPPTPARRRTMLLALLGASAVAAAAVLGTVLVVQGLDDPGSVREDTGNGASGDSSSDTFDRQSPWRLRIEDAISEVSGGVDVGCDVTLTHIASDDMLAWDGLYGIKTFQMRESGTFRSQVSDPGCRLTPQKGDGGVVELGFEASGSGGDTPVFESPGAVYVRVEDWEGNSSCVLRLMSDSDGRQLDSREPTESQTSVRLESNGPRRVYIAAPTCLIHVSDTP